MTGTRKVTFLVVPKGTAFSGFDPAYSEITVRWKKQTANTDGYQINYADNANFHHSKKIKISKNTAIQTKLTGLKGNTVYYFRIRTWKKIAGTTFYSPWSSVKMVNTGGKIYSIPSQKIKSSSRYHASLSNLEGGKVSNCGSFDITPYVRVNTSYMYKALSNQGYQKAIRYTGGSKVFPVIKTARITYNGAFYKGVHLLGHSTVNKGDGVPNNDCWVKNIVFDGVAFTSRCIYRYRVVEKEKNTSAEATKTWSKPNYTWNESNTFVTAERYCKEDPVVMETEKASVSANVSRQATVKTMGVTVILQRLRILLFQNRRKPVRIFLC